MPNNPKYIGGDLVAIVWPTANEPLVIAGHLTWEAAAREAWAMSADKAERVRILLAATIANDIAAAWAVTGSSPRGGRPARQAASRQSLLLHDRR